MPQSAQKGGTGGLNPIRSNERMFFFLNFYRGTLLCQEVFWIQELYLRTYRVFPQNVLHGRYFPHKGGCLGSKAAARLWSVGSAEAFSSALTDVYNVYNASFTIFFFHISIDNAILSVTL